MRFHVPKLRIATMQPPQTEFRSPNDGKRKANSPWVLQAEASAPDRYRMLITEFDLDGTAYVFINRRVRPAAVHWFWNR